MYSFQKKSYILNITVLYRKISGPFPPIPLKIFQSGVPAKTFTSTQSIQKQTIGINLEIPNGLFMVQSFSSNFKKEKLLILVKYRVP